MFELIQIQENSIYINDICCLLTRYYDLIFSNYVNPIASFFSELQKEKVVVIAAIKEGKLIAFLVVYNFQKISKNSFNCFIYGAAVRSVAFELDLAMNYIFDDLKEKGCNVVRLETKEYNMPMRKMANRLGFSKVGCLHNSCLLNGEYKNTILYEKIL